MRVITDLSVGEQPLKTRLVAQRNPSRIAGQPGHTRVKAGGRVFQRPLENIDGALVLVRHGERGGCTSQQFGINFRVGHSRDQRQRRFGFANRVAGFPQACPCLWPPARLLLRFATGCSPSSARAVRRASGA